MSAHVIDGPWRRDDGVVVFEGRLRAWLDEVQRQLRARNVELKYEYLIRSDPSLLGTDDTEPCPPLNVVCPCNMLCRCDYKLMVAVGWEPAPPPGPPDPRASSGSPDVPGLPDLPDVP